MAKTNVATVVINVKMLANLYKLENTCMKKPSPC